MDAIPDSIATNRAHWDERAPAHAASPDYDVDRFRTDPAFLSDVVRFDLPRLGDVDGLRGVHLQCHIGTDTVSLARLGARMTGLDFSPAALHQARELAQAAGADVEFVEAELYRAPDVLPTGAFDLVYTGIGALCWLPDIRRWAEVVASLLRPGGRLFLREGHPVLWSLDEKRDDALVIGFPYFEHEAPLVFDDPAPMSTPTSRSPTPRATAGTTASARSSRRCSTRAWSSRSSSSTTPSRGTLFPDR